MAIATATVTFTATDSAAFTWSPALTTNPPSVLACCVTVTDGSGGVSAYLAAAPSNVGGTAKASASFTGTVVLVASD